jgi:hypothetical protein
VNGSSVMGYQPSQPIMPERRQVTSTIELVESCLDQLRGIADVVEVGGSQQHLGILRREMPTNVPPSGSHRPGMVPPAPQRTQQLLGKIFGPDAQLHAFTVGRTASKRERACEDFLYRIKRPACGRPWGAVLGRLAVSRPS